MLKFFCYSTCVYNRNLIFSAVALPSPCPLWMPKPLPNTTPSLQVFQAMSDGGQLKVYSLLTRPQHHPSSCLLGAKTTHIGTRGCAFVPSLHQQGRRRPTVFRRTKSAAAAKHFIPGPSAHPAVNFVVSHPWELSKWNLVDEVFEDFLIPKSLQEYVNCTLLLKGKVFDGALRWTTNEEVIAIEGNVSIICFYKVSDIERKKLKVFLHPAGLSLIKLRSQYQNFSFHHNRGEGLIAEIKDSTMKAQ